MSALYGLKEIYQCRVLYIKFDLKPKIFFQNLLRCSWAPDGSKVAAGSGDRFVYIWDTTSRRILYKLPGHAGSVNEVDFHPEEPISKHRSFYCTRFP